MPQIKYSPYQAKTTPSQIRPTKTTTPAVGYTSQGTSTISNIFSSLSSFFTSLLKTAVQPLTKFFGTAPSTLPATIHQAGLKGITFPISSAPSHTSRVVSSPTTYAVSTPPYFEPKPRESISVPKPVSSPTPLVSYRSSSRDIIKPGLPLSSVVPLARATGTPLSQVSTSSAGALSTETIAHTSEPQRETTTGTIGGSSLPSVALTPAGQQLVQELIQSTLPSSIKTNVPSDAQVYVYKDPIGGSTQVFEHVIKSGENLSKIARDYGVSIDEILRINQDNKRAIKSPNLIIAGETIRIPVKTKTIPPEEQIRKQVLDSSQKPLADINQLISQILEQAKKKTPLIPERDFSNVFSNLFQDQLNALQTAVQNLENLHPINYQEQYQKLLERSGIPEDYQRIFDLNKIIRQTKDDVLREAVASGGIVTQSQVEEIVNFRTSMLKNELSALTDLVELKEKMIDRTMRYVEMDRKELDNYFDRILGLREKISQFSFNALKWNYDYYDDLMNKNKTRLMDYVKNGSILDLSLETLSNFANPNSMLYAGLSPEELSALLRVAQRLREKEELQRQEIIERMQRAREQEKRAEERAKIERQRLELQKEREQQRRLREREQKEIEKERLRIQKERLELQKQGKTKKSVNLEGLIPD